MAAPHLSTIFDEIILFKTERPQQEQDILEKYTLSGKKNHAILVTITPYLDIWTDLWFGVSQMPDIIPLRCQPVLLLFHVLAFFGYEARWISTRDGDHEVYGKDKDLIPVELVTHSDLLFFLRTALLYQTCEASFHCDVSQGLLCFAQACSGCSQRGLLFIAMLGLLLVVVSLAEEHRF
ncbi:hypothetical protein MJT46_006667 [Ovis ammon polii x Ovis aries]|nr:hypothetical protein MJT46_006667 [Ovis ammon polii x Ovis aries]